MLRSRRPKPEDKPGQDEQAGIARAPDRVAQILDLQRTAGNRAVARILIDEVPPTTGTIGTPGPDPAAAQLEADWNDPVLAEARHHFAGEGRPAGAPKQRYLGLAPYYKRKGIERPLKWVKENIVEATFFGATTPAHTNMKKALADAEDKLRAKGVTEKPFSTCYAFNARTTSSGEWSNHADGKAVDIDAAKNPHLTDEREKQVISALTGFDISAANPVPGSGGGYEASKLVSDLFQELYTSEGFEERIAELEVYEADLEAAEEAIEGELAAVPKHKPSKKKLSKEERDQIKADSARAKELTAKLKAKHKEIEAVKGRQSLLSREKSRMETLAPLMDKTRTQIATLLQEIEALEAQIETLQAEMDVAAKAAEHAPEPPPTKDKKELAARRAAAQQARKDAARQGKDLAALKGKRRAAQKSVAKAQASIDPLSRYAQEGFVNVDEQLVYAMQDAGLTWGGDWKGSKDFMHFDSK